MKVCLQAEGRKADGKLFFCADRRHRNPHLVSDRFDHQDPGGI